MLGGGRFDYVVVVQELGVSSTKYCRIRDFCLKDNLPTEKCTQKNQDKTLPFKIFLLCSINVLFPLVFQANSLLRPVLIHQYLNAPSHALPTPDTSRYSMYHPSSLLVILKPETKPSRRKHSIRQTGPLSLVIFHHHCCPRRHISRFHPAKILLDSPVPSLS